MTKKYILALDQGTTSSRTVVFDKTGRVVGMLHKEITQIFPQKGWVEHNPQEIWDTQRRTITGVLKKNKISLSDIAAIGITNQRETTIIWDKKTGTPIYNAIVWQDRRTASICEALRKKGFSDYIRKNTGLVVDAYFSATKILWLLDNVKDARGRAENGELLFGTVDTWLLWKLTQGKVHATDYSNASRTMLFNIRTLQWDKKMLKMLDIPESMMPEVRDSGGYFGEANIDGTGIPITGIAGDQQAALFGQLCFEPGMAKNTYGTGCFMLMNTGNKIYNSRSGLLTTIAWGIAGKITYALEGSVFIAGAAVQWLRDGLKIIGSSAASEKWAKKVKDSGGIYVVPAFVGLGAPHWNMYARGAVFGLTRDTGKAHIIRATLESIAYQTRDVLNAMEKDTGIKLKKLQVDGGASSNNLLMQFQSDILGVSVERPEVVESTAFGAAALAGIAAGFWNKKDIVRQRRTDKVFSPAMTENTRRELCDGWKKAVERIMM